LRAGKILVRAKFCQKKTDISKGAEIGLKKVAST